MALLVRSTETSDARMAAACLRVLQAIVTAVGDAPDAVAADDVSDKVCRLVAKQKMHVDAIFTWARYSPSMVMSSSPVAAPASAMASRMSHGGVSCGGVGAPNGSMTMNISNNNNSNANGQVHAANGGDGSSFDGVAARSRPAAATGAAGTGPAAVRNEFAVSNVHSSVGIGCGVGGGGYVPGQVMTDIDLNCDMHEHEFHKRAALRRRFLTQARKKRQLQQLKKQARKTHVTSAAQQNVDNNDNNDNNNNNNSNNSENVNMNVNNNAADPMIVDGVSRKDDPKPHQAKEWDGNNAVSDDEYEDGDENEDDIDYLDEDDIDDGDVGDGISQFDGLLPLLHGNACGSAVLGNGVGVVGHGLDSASATAAGAGAAEGIARTPFSLAQASTTPASAAKTAMALASSTSVQCEALRLIEAVTSLLMERDRNHHHQIRQQNEKRKQHRPSSSTPSNPGPNDEGKAEGKATGGNGDDDDDDEVGGDGDKDGEGDDSSVDAMWAFVERGYDVVCDVLLHGAQDEASIEAALGMLALAAMYAPYLITDYGGIEGLCAMLARLYWWLQPTDNGHNGVGGGDVKSDSRCCWDRQTVVAMVKACVHVLVLVAPALNASRNKVDVNGAVRLTGLGVLAALAWPRQGLGATPPEFIVCDDDTISDGADVVEGNDKPDDEEEKEEAKKKVIAGDGSNDGGVNKADDDDDDDAGQQQQQEKKTEKKKSGSKARNKKNGGVDDDGFRRQFVEDCQKAWTLLHRRTKNK